uniref:Uncharacterized protein n=1 Tax=Arundo donax TaxID=35708 RepID=A0A0A8ZR87_ARUDO
MARRRTSMA